MIARFLFAAFLCTSLHAETVLDVVRVIPSETVTLRDPRSMSVSADGTLYVADTGHHRILAVDSSGQLIHETGGLGRDHGQFQWPRKIIANRGAAVWVLDYGNRRIEKFSRTLDYQGTFVVPSDDESAAFQIEECALSPQGDLYVFDRDNGRLLRYDPLFRVQAELGQNRGTEFVSALTRMTFVPGVGVSWWERGRSEIRVANTLLTQVRTLQFYEEVSTSALVLSAVDSCLVSGTIGLLRLWCDQGAPADSLVILKSHPDLPLTRLDDVAFADRRTMYALDGRAGVILRVSLSER